MRVVRLRPNLAARQCRLVLRLPWVSTTPLGIPVLPEV